MSNGEGDQLDQQPDKDGPTAPRGPAGPGGHRGPGPRARRKPPDFDSRRRQQSQATRDALNRRQLQRGRRRVDLSPQGRGGGEVEYLYVDAVLTTRSADLPAVEANLPAMLAPGQRWVTQPDRPIEGVATLSLPEGSDVDGICRQFDELIRLGAVMPMGVVHITPTACCPATEPVVPSTPPRPPLPDPAISCDGDLGRGVKVVVIDTGRRKDVEDAHPWLSSVTGDKESRDVGHYRGHGTFVCGVLRAVAPKAEIDVNGKLVTLGAVVEEELVVDLREAILSDHAQVISMSAGTTSRDGLPPIALSVACELLAASHTVLVAAAGNDGSTEPFYPAYLATADPRVNREALANVVSVGALDPDGALAPYSNYQWPIVYARGSQVVNAYPYGHYDYEEDPKVGQSAEFVDGMASWDGTSFATPVVAGLIAGRMSRHGESAEQAWVALDVTAQAQALPGIGPMLKPEDG